jgi:hypothetical protein
VRSLTLLSGPSAATEQLEHELAVEIGVIRFLVVAGCSYEVFALSTGRVPTLSRVTQLHPWFGGAVLATLAMHFYYERRVVGVLRRLSPIR